MKIGLIADTHMPGSLDRLWPAAVDAFRDVDCILHAGDLHTLEIVDALSGLAPTYVARGNGDVGIEDERLRDNWCLDFKNVRVGLIHHFPSPARKPAAAIARHIDKHFEHTPEVVIFGHTHFEGMYRVENTLCVNPGSPTLPRNQSVRMGTVGFLEIHDDRIDASIHQITESGIEPHAELEAHVFPRAR